MDEISSQREARPPGSVVGAGGHLGAVDRLPTPDALAPHLELRELLAEVVLPEHERRWGRSTEWDALVDFQRQLSAHRWTAPAWPVEVGGRGLDVGEQIACEAEFRRADAPNRVAVYGVNNVGPTILAAGRPDQLHHATAIAEATELWCQGFSEPDHGSDLGGLRCRAEVDGDDLVINGSKIWTSIGLHATHCMLLARTDPTSTKHRGISALLVPLDLPGIGRRPIRQMDGAAEFAELHFDDVRVPTSSVLGPMNEGWGITMTTLAFERSGLLSQAGQLSERVYTWVSSGALDDAVLRDRAMRCWTLAKILGWMGERSLARAPSSVPDISGSLIKLAWSELARDAARLATDALGPYALVGDEPTVLDFLWSPAFTVAGGTSEVNRNIIGERGLGLPKESLP